MSPPRRVGLLDSGIGPAAGPVVASAAFTGRPLAPDRLDHGSALARIIWHHAPATPLLNAQVFGDGMRSSAERIAAGVAWLCEEEAAIIVMSLGLRADRPVLRDAIEAAVGAGRILLASMPARGAPVFPAAYPGVIRITGDARCGLGEISELAAAPAHFGASPTELGGRLRGASFAVAHVAGMLAAAAGAGEDPLGDLRRRAVFRGPERRASGSPI